MGGPFLQENFLRVLPLLVFNIVFVQIPIAADSLLEPFRAFTVLRTAFMHLQNRFAKDSFILHRLGN